MTGAETLRAARDRYFLENDMPPDGGYGRPWIDLHLGPWLVTLPTLADPGLLVRYHDLHHVLTGYPTDLAGEAEVAAWLLAQGCPTLGSWGINLLAFSYGLVMHPRRTRAAFRRGRLSENLFGQPYEALLERRVEEARAACRIPEELDPIDVSENPRFLWVALLALPFAALVAVVSPLLLLARWLTGWGESR